MEVEVEEKEKKVAAFSGFRDVLSSYFYFVLYIFFY